MSVVELINFQMIKQKSITVNVVNLRHRTDRQKHIIKQFSDKPEFLINIVPAIVHEKGSYGLWQTILQIVYEEKKRGSDFFILCEDDHTFTENYSDELLINSILQAKSLNADMLSGGYSWFRCAVQISKNIFWVDKFTGMQFTVIFNKFYQPILDTNFGEEVIADLSLSDITDYKFVIYPYISIQREFGYSDVTLKNAEKGYVNRIFNTSIERLNILNKVRNFYSLNL